MLLYTSKQVLSNKIHKMKNIKNKASELGMYGSLLTLIGTSIPFWAAVSGSKLPLFALLLSLVLNIVGVFLNYKASELRKLYLKQMKQFRKEWKKKLEEDEVKQVTYCY